MGAEGFSTPQRAAIGDIPEVHCRVVASAVSGDAAYVLLDTGTEANPYPYGVHCYRENRLWYEAGGGNSGGWALLDKERGTGTLAFWEEAAEGADAVRIRYKARTHELPVQEGYFLFVRWHVPSDHVQDIVQALAFRINGTWQPRPFQELRRERRDNKKMRELVERLALRESRGSAETGLYREKPPPESPN